MSLGRRCPCPAPAFSLGLRGRELSAAGLGARFTGRGLCKDSPETLVGGTELWGAVCCMLCGAHPAPAANTEGLALLLGCLPSAPR